MGRIVLCHYSAYDGIDAGYCVYCGEPAEHIDHVLPVRYSNWRLDLTPEERAQLLTVPACAECNQLAGSKAFHSIADKRDFIRIKIRKRYAKILAGPVWTDAEIAELGRGLRDHIEACQAKRRLIGWRLIHEGIPAEAASAVPIVDERLECSICGDLAWCSVASIDDVLAMVCRDCSADREYADAG